MKSNPSSNGRDPYGSLFDLFEAEESVALPVLGETAPVLAGVGSVVGKALASPLLLEALAARGVRPAQASAYADLAALKAAPRWSMGLVLSPWKLQSLEICDDLTPAARSAGVVDTILRDGNGALIGVNTNVFGLAHALRRMARGVLPESCLILGTGATSRCAAIALARAVPGARVGVMGRNERRTAELAERFGLDVVTQAREYAAQVVVNCTTVGETSDQPIDLPIDDFLLPETLFLDLNNRPSQFQAEALARGCVTISGVIMQRAVNMLRAHLLARDGDRAPAQERAAQASHGAGS